MNDILRLSLLFILSVASLGGFFAVLGVFFPKRLANTRLLMAERPGRSFLLGLVNFAFFSILAFGLSQIAENGHNNFLYLIAILLTAMLLIGVSFALAATAEAVGERLASQARGLWRTAAGTALLSLACVLPLVGWFGLLPYALFSGLGGFILSFFSLPAGNPLADKKAETSFHSS